MLPRVMDWGERFGADKAEGTVLVLFIPSVDRQENPIDIDRTYLEIKLSEGGD